MFVGVSRRGKWVISEIGEKKQMKDDDDDDETCRSWGSDMAFEIAFLGKRNRMNGWMLVRSLDRTAGMS